jgi:hypothetical protein
MKRRLALFSGSLALSLCFVAMMVSARLDSASAPPRPGKEAEEAPRIAASKLTHVTVYPDSAMVTREVEVPAGAGLVELVINPLPEATVASSLYSESSDGIRVLTTRFRSRPVKEDTREEVRKIEDEIHKLQQEARKIQSEMKAIESNVGLLAKLETFTAASTTHATEKGKLDADAAIALAKYLMEGRVEKSKQIVALQEQIQTNSEAMEFANRRMRNLTSGTSKVERDAVIVVDKVNNGAGKVKLNYLVTAAAWRPQYKFRSGKNGKDPVAVEYLAAVMQQTGEDWERVGITLSTAQPMLNAAPPDLNALAVVVVPRGTAAQGVTVSGLQSGLGLAGGPGGGGFGGRMPAPGGGPAPGIPGAMGGTMATNSPAQYGNQAKVPANRFALTNPVTANTSRDELKKAADLLRQRAQETYNRNNEKDASELTNYAAVLDQACELVMTSGTTKLGESPRAPKNEGPSVTYHLANRLSVPSRNDDQVIEVARLEMQPDYFYKAVPVLTPHVYRQANLVNKSTHVLLPGEATMYNGTDFVGRMSLPLVAVGEEFTVGFGAEPQLQVQRQLLDRSRAMQAGNQILKYDYRILVSSYKGEKVRVQVWDRLPHAEKEAMGVNLLKVSPELCKDPVYVREERANNLLRWDLDVEPEMRGEKAIKIAYEFHLELDKQATIGSFLAK